ncbi:MAG: DUF4421 family protein [Salinivirgaceae bacterium]|jgi:hypothetical protein|nr:DUF4421 family protein [Salinivirgaceae bacterium]
MKNIIFCASLMLLLALIQPKTLIGQSFFELNSYKRENVDSTHILSFYKDLNIGLLIGQKQASISIADVEKESFLEYTPNTTTSIGLKLTYKWLGFNLGVGLGQSDATIIKYGKTERLDLQINTHFRKYVTDIYLQLYNGMYLNNMADFNSLYNEFDMVHYQRPDIRFLNIGISSRYAWNYDKFSYKAAFDFNEKQLKRAGSLLIGGYSSISSIQTDSTLVPHFARGEFGEESLFTRISSFNLGISIGYIYTFVIKDDFFITLEISPGIGIQTINASKEQGTSLIENNGIGLTSTARYSVGYSKRRFYTAITGVNSSTSIINENKNTINLQHGNVLFVLGYRFALKREIPLGDDFFKHP